MQNGIIVAVLLCFFTCYAYIIYIAWKQVTSRFPPRGNFHLVTLEQLEKEAGKSRNKPHGANSKSFVHISNCSTPFELEKSLEKRILHESILVLNSNSLVEFKRSQKTECDQISSSIITKLRENKISLEALLEVSDVSKELIEQNKGLIEKEKKLRRTRLDVTFRIAKLLNDQGIDYMVIKLNDHFSLTQMDDVDIIPRTISDELEALKLLKERGYSFYHLAIGDPFKITAYTKDHLVGVDFYPEFEWLRFYFFRMRVISKEEIFMRKRCIAVKEGLVLYTPSVEDDILIVMSHDFAHRSVLYSNVIHVLTLLENESINWSYLIDMVLRNGLLIPFYIYIYVLDVYSGLAHGNLVIPQFVTNFLNNIWLCKVIRKILKWKRLSFPFQVPFCLLTLDFVCQLPLWLKRQILFRK